MKYELYTWTYDRNWDQNWVPNFTQPLNTKNSGNDVQAPRRKELLEELESKGDNELIEVLGLRGCPKGTVVTCLPGEIWRCLRHYESGREVIIPYYHVSNLGRLVSHVHHPSYNKKFKCSDTWSKGYNCLAFGKMKSTKGLDGKWRDRIHYKIKYRDGDKWYFAPLLLPEGVNGKNAPFVSAAAEQGTKDIGSHQIIAATFIDICEVPPTCRDTEFLRDIGWDRMSKKGKRKMASLFEIDHMNQRCYDSRWTNLERKRGVDNNFEALIARGGNHSNSHEEAFVSSKESVLDQFFV